MGFIWQESRQTRGILTATAADSLCDCISTSAVLIGVFIAMATGKNPDGWIGALVALFVCFAGFTAARDTIQPLLGQAPDPELVKKIKERVLSEEKILGVHDLIIHDYGPGRRMISLHAEVSYKEDILETEFAYEFINMGYKPVSMRRGIVLTHR